MSKPISWKKLTLGLIKIALSVLILSWLFYKARQDNQFADIASREKNWVWLLVAFQLVFLAHFVSFVRWRMLVRAIEIPFSTLDATRIGLIGVFFGFFAFGLVGGDSLRIYYAARNVKQKIPEVICSVFLDRAIGMLVMFTFATIGFLFVDLSVVSAENSEQINVIRYICWIIGVATAIGWTFAMLFVLSPRLLTSTAMRRLTRLPKIGAIIEQLIGAVLLYRQKIGCVVSCLGWSAVVNTCFVAAVYLTAVGINVEHPPFEKHFIVAPISMTANAIPLPGGIGGMEFVLSYFYDAMSEQTSYGVVVAFAYRVHLLLIGVLGAIAWFFNRQKIENVVSGGELPIG